MNYDLWQSERALHDAGAIATGIERLRTYGLTYDKDGALWLRTTASGDNEDRVVVRSDGRPAYFANDVAYHYDKLQRADRVIDILGPDHHGYIARLHALADAYGRRGAIEALIAQQITLKRGDEIVSMSKRAGQIVTLADVMTRSASTRRASSSSCSRSSSRSRSIWHWRRNRRATIRFSTFSTATRASPRFCAKRSSATPHSSRRRAAANTSNV